MTNRGVAPLDPLTPVGQFRLTYGDTEYVPLDPVEPGFGNYTELSDDEITMFLNQGQNNITRAIGKYYMRLSGEAAKQSKEVEDYDLRVNLMKRSEDLRKTAQLYFDQADQEDYAAGTGDIFESYKFGGLNTSTPEAAAYPLDVY